MTKNESEQCVYKEGYQAFLHGVEELACPYETGSQGALGEFWLDGFEDAKDDESERPVSL